MKEEELAKLKQPLYWSGGLIAFARVLELAFRSIAAYQANKTIDEIAGDMNRAV